MSGIIPPGSRLIERELAEEMGVSRVPIREAIRMLQSEHLVSVQAHRRVIVRSLDAREVADLFDVREALEVMEARLAAARATSPGLVELRRLLDAAWNALEANNRSAMNEANASFHGQVALMAGNAVLTSILDPISARLRWLYAQNAEPRRVLEEHEAILTAISAGEPETAAEVALNHVRAARQMVMRTLGPGDAGGRLAPQFGVGRPGSD